MSRVTDVILTFSLGDVDAMQTVNRALRDASDGQALVLTSAHEPQDEVSGGRKRLQASVAMAAFNYVSNEILIEAVRSHEWKMPERVHLFVQGEHDEDGFTELRWRPTKGPLDDVWDVVLSRYLEAVEVPERFHECEAMKRVLDTIADAKIGLETTS